MIKKKLKIKALTGTPFLISEDQIIGTGSFGTVYRAYNKEDPSKQLVAKVIPNQTQNMDSIESQLKFIKQIPYHANLVNCQRFHISSERNIYLIMEYCNGGSFQSYLIKHPNLQQKHIWKFINDFCKGYRILYDLHLVHRDIKPENILLHNDTLKIADFGLVRRLNHHSITQNISMKGTPLYMAPELRNQEKGSSKVDVFSFGIVLYRLSFCGQFPFYRKDHEFSTIQKYFQHLNKAKFQIPRYPKRSQKLTNLLTKMLEKQEEKRMNWKQIFDYCEINFEERIEKDDPQLVKDIQSSMVIINRSSAKIELINQPFNFRESVEDETKELINFIQYSSSFSIFKLKQFTFKSKIILSIIKHLKKVIDNIVKVEKFHIYIMEKLTKIKLLGVVYGIDLIKTITMKIKKQIPEEIENNLQLLANLKTLLQEYEIDRQEQKILKKYTRLQYQNQLYDFLTQFSQYPSNIKELIKIPVSFMMDLYDACLKLEALKVQGSQYELEDTEIDRIDIEHPNKYAEYLQMKQQVTLHQIQEGLQKLGLLFI